MAATNIRFYARVVAAFSSLLTKQLGICSAADADLGYKMLGYKDGDGTARQILCKDQPARVTTLQLTSTLTLAEDVVVPAGKAIYLCKVGTDKTSSGTIKLYINAGGDFEAAII